MFTKNATTQYPIHELIAARWSGRAYDPEHMVPRDTLLGLLEAARWAPSCFGEQPWRIVICDRHVDLPAWEQARACLNEGNRSWAGAAPVLLVVAAVTHFAHNGKPNRFAEYDTGAALMNLCLQASASGLMAHQMGGFDTVKAREAFAIPAECTVMSMVSLGYQLPADEIPESLRERELAERSRHSLSETFFESEWHRPPEGIEV